MNELKIYKSSAGSGKTFTLVSEYLRLVLLRPEDYRHILAITFTNKAAAEMKSRVIDSLVSLSSGEESQMKKILSAEEKLSGVDIEKRAGIALNNILHDYSSFSISTIDSFFQRVIRSLAKEMHLPLNMEVEISLDDAVLEVTDRLMKNLGEDKELADWLTDLALMKMEDEKGWYIEKDIQDIARELFREDLKNIKILSRDEIKKLHADLSAAQKKFTAKLNEAGRRALAILDKHGLTIDDFSYGRGGVMGYFGKITSACAPDDYVLKKRAIDALASASKWVTQKHPRRNEIESIVEDELMPVLEEVSDYVNSNFEAFITACEINRKLYLFGIVGDLQKKFTEYRNENNKILLSDTTRLLSETIHHHDTPFVYEKTGNKFRHILIDEFQDTSGLQWANLMPLVINTLGSGFMAMVVGDAKQSIYRWRGGKMSLLIRDILIDLKNFASIFNSKVLETNYRSRKAIVDFNNRFFSEAAKLPLIPGDATALGLAYGKDLEQKFSEKNSEGGYVRICFLDKEESDDGEEESWKQSALKRMLADIRSLLGENYSYRDIAILVRRNIEGSEIAEYLLNNGIDKLISPDSLLITASPRIGFLINVFRFLSDQSNLIARGELLYYYGTFLSGGDSHSHAYFADHKKSKKRKQQNGTLFEVKSFDDNIFNRILPPAFTQNLSSLARLPVYELSEQIAGIFGLNMEPDAYIQRFQDLTLEYSVKFDSSLAGFVRWWDESSVTTKCSVIIPANEDAIRIMTIHSAKGLQFPVVIMPFCDWNIMPKSNKLIWLRAEKEPFNEMGPVALLTSKRLEQTAFRDEYNEEVGQTAIDNLNLLYVAFTRPEEKLLVYTPVAKKDELNCVSRIIARVCNVMGLNEDGSFEAGSPDHARSTRKESSDGQTVKLEKYISNRWQDKLKLSTHSRSLLNLIGTKTKAKINYGLLAHEILAAITHPDEAEMLIDKYVFEGLINSEDQSKLKEEISSVLRNESIRKFFDSGYEVKAEREILLPGGEVLRPDRVLLNGKEAIVIDFKTGAREPEHEKQVSRYGQVLGEMGYGPVKKYLVYLSEQEVAEVT